MRRGKTKLIGGTLALVGILMLTMAGFARQEGGRGFGAPPPGGHGRGEGRRGDVLGPFAHDLNLTDAQKAQVKQIAESFEESTKSLREQLFKSGGTPFDGLDATFDEATVRAAAQARAGIQVELEVARAKMLSQVYALLTSEQKAKLAELRQQFAQGRREPGSDF